MRKDYDFIINTLFRTTNSYSSVSLSFAKELAKTNRVFYVNHPYSYKDIWSGRKEESVKKNLGNYLTQKTTVEYLSEIPENFVAYTPPATIPINQFSAGKLYNTLHKRNQNVVLNTVRKIISDNHLKDFVYLTCFDPFFLPVLPKNLGAAFNVYQCIDDISTEPYVAKHGVRLEEQAARDSDFTIVTSTKLWQHFKEFQPETYILHNAVDISIFKDCARKHYERPEEIKNVTTKIIGFVGNLDPVRIDYPLLKSIATAHPDKTLLLVGPINSPEISNLDLDKMPNVILTGGKKIYDIPQYLKFMDVAILPSLLNKMSLSVYPLKINEYLAAGKSIIATNFSEDIRSFSNLIRIADSHAHFNALINDAINDYPEEKITARERVANTNTWGDRVRQFWEILDKHENKILDRHIDKHLNSLKQWD